MFHAYERLSGFGGRTLGGLLLLIGLMVPSGAQALSIPIVNAGFEADVLADGAAQVGSVTGWTGHGDGAFGVINAPVGWYPGEAPEGDNIFFSKGPDDGAFISQVLATTLTANTIYTLEIEVGHRLDRPFGGYTLQLAAGGVVLATDLDSVTPAEGSFTTASLVFQTGSSPDQLGEALEIRFRSNATQDGIDDQTQFDNVRLDASAAPVPVPEPGVALILIGSAGLAWGMRRGHAA